MERKKFSYMIIGHGSGKSKFYQIFIREGKFGMYQSLTSKLFKSKIAASKYVREYIKKENGGLK